MKFSKWLVALVLVLFAAGALVGCGGSQPAEQEGQQQQGAEESKEPIKIGINYELSGEVATYGSNTKNAIVMAFEEINASGGVLDGRLIDPIVLDNKSDNAEATSVGTRLITKDKVAVHLGPATTGATLAGCRGNPI